MDPSAVLDLKAFIPAKDYATSKQFYLDLGFRLNWGSDQTSELQIGDFRFLLVDFYVEQYASNFMMHLQVEDADPWWKYINDTGLPKRYPGIMAKPPTLQPWGLRVLYLSDPSGVLWHIADRRGA